MKTCAGYTTRVHVHYMNFRYIGSFHEWNSCLSKARLVLAPKSTLTRYDQLKRNLKAVSKYKRTYAHSCPIILKNHLTVCECVFVRIVDSGAFGGNWCFCEFQNALDQSYCSILAITSPFYPPGGARGRLCEATSDCVGWSLVLLWVHSKATTRLLL